MTGSMRNCFAPAEVSTSVFERADEYCTEFLGAVPFKHITIDNFFDAAFARQLLAEFPRFDPDLARNEFGVTGGKAVNTDIGSIGPAYQRLYHCISAKPFLELVSRLSDIPELILDPKMFGGGTHENSHGQELDPHVDFNYDEACKLHRRLNLIVYLNPGWQPEWGGALEIHSNPRNPEKNLIRSYNPLFNRCVMFETNEYSWHGFPRIDLPADKRDLSRKSISIYLYTRTRPAEEIAPLHATFYVQRPLPERITPGYTLSVEDVAELRALLIRRDRWIERYQQMEMEKNRSLAEADTALSHLRGRVPVPVTGYILQEGNTEGLYGDGWTASRAKIGLKPLRPVSGFVLRGFRPPSAPMARTSIRVRGAKVASAPIQGAFEMSLSLEPPADAPLEIELVSDSPPGWAASNGDRRDLAFILTELRALH